MSSTGFLVLNDDTEAYPSLAWWIEFECPHCGTVGGFQSRDVEPLVREILSPILDTRPHEVQAWRCSAPETGYDPDEVLYDARLEGVHEQSDDCDQPLLSSGRLAFNGHRPAAEGWAVEFCCPSTGHITWIHDRVYLPIVQDMIRRIVETL